MDIVMDWQLIYRTPDEMLDIADEIAEYAQISTWVDPIGSIVYLEITKFK